MDQFGNALSGDALSAAPAVAWEASAGTINTAGLYAAPGSPTTIAITASCGSASQSVSLSVSDLPTAMLAFASGGAVSEGDTGTVSFTNKTAPIRPRAHAGFTYSYDFGDTGQFEIADSTSPTAVVPAEYLADAQSSLTVRGRVQDPAGDWTDYTTTIPIMTSHYRARADRRSNRRCGASLAISDSFSDPGLRRPGDTGDL